MSNYALCIYGNFNNRLKKNSGNEGYKYILENLIAKHDFDIFIYSNDRINASAICAKWEGIATKLLIETPKDFDVEISKNGINLRDFVPIENFRTLQNTLAFLNSRSESINLMQEHSRAEGKKYDWVVTCRFDLGQIDRYNGFRPQKVSEINFNPELDSNFIYSAMWNQSNAGFADQWFYGNQDNISKLTLMPQKCLEYFKDDSDYLMTIGKGLPYSNNVDHLSNESLLAESNQSKELVKIEKSDAINNHLIHKYFFLEQNLFNKHRMIGNIPNVARVLYSHTDYSDCWLVTFGQIMKYMNCFSKNYVFVNRRDTRIPAFFTQIIYDESLSYVDRLIFGLNQIQEEVVFFEHEDMFVSKMPNTTLITNFSTLLRTKPIHRYVPWKFDVIRLIQGGRFLSIPVPGKKFSNLHKISRLSPWIFSLQPSLWSRSRILEVLNKHKGLPIWEFERKAQRTFRNPFFRAATLKENLSQIGTLHSSSEVYPYIATAVVKGKWNFSEYQLELEGILEEYNIDPELRGKL
jgi:hypothetical protein